VDENQALKAAIAELKIRPADRRRLSRSAKHSPHGLRRYSSKDHKRGEVHEAEFLTLMQDDAK
jgi:hypothetical protein